MTGVALQASAVTDAGRRRLRNEDAYVYDLDLALFFVADGMGGHERGHVASALACSSMVAAYGNMRGDAPWNERNLADGILAANGALLDASADLALDAQPPSEVGKARGMSATVVALSFEGQDAVVSWAGDSRCYRLRGRRLELLTKDHAGWPRNAVWNGVGLRGCKPDLVRSRWRHGDVYLLCSDGLNKMLGDTEIGRALLVARENDLLVDVGPYLVEAANEAGGHDNVTVVVVRVM